MLVGSYPFEDPENPKDFRKTIQRVINVQYSIPEQVVISEECRHLISRIFVADPAQVSDWILDIQDLFLIHGPNSNASVIFESLSIYQGMMHYYQSSAYSCRLFEFKCQKKRYNLYSKYACTIFYYLTLKESWQFLRLALCICVCLVFKSHRIVISTLPAHQHT